MTDYSVKGVVPTAGIHPHLGIFNKNDSGPVHLDAVLIYAIKQADLDVARSTFDTKWWDYRFVHPGYCFYLFASLYGQATKRWRIKFGVPVHAKNPAVLDPIWRTKPDPEDPDKTVMHLTDPGYRTGLWRAMCYADAHGLPYDRFIEWSFQFAFESVWQRYPRPSQMANIRMIDYALKRWDEDRAEMITLPRDPSYRIENYQGHPYQDAFQDWLMESIRKRAHPDVSLARYLSEEPFITLDRAKDKLGEDVVRRALQRLDSH